MTTTRTTLLTGMLFVATALGLSACGPIVPLNPTWEQDVRPLMVARCIRCHNDPPVMDPAVDTNKFVILKGTAINLNYLKFSDIPSTLLPSIMKCAQIARGELMGFPRMPPPPAEALEDWQIEILDAWAVSPR